MHVSVYNNKSDTQVFKDDHLHTIKSLNIQIATLLSSDKHIHVTLKGPSGQVAWLFDR